MHPHRRALRLRGGSVEEARRVAPRRDRTGARGVPTSAGAARPDSQVRQADRLGQTRGAPRPLRQREQRAGAACRGPEGAGTPGSPPLRLEGDTRDGWTAPDGWAHFARTGEWKGSVLHPEYVETALAKLKGQRFALVIRTEHFTQAAEAGEDGFVPARFEGDAVLVDLVDAKVVGGFPLDLGGKDTLFVMSRKGPIRGMRMGESVEDASDLQRRRKLGIAVAEGLEALVPGATPPHLGSYLRDRPSKPATKKK